MAGLCCKKTTRRLYCKKEADLGAWAETSTRGPWHDRAAPLHMASLRSRDHAAVPALVRALFLELQRSRRDDVGARAADRSHHDLPLGALLRARTGATLPPSPERATTDSWRVDETSVEVKGVGMYLYRAVDSAGNTLEFWLSATRDAPAAKGFLVRALGASHTVTPRVITVDTNAASPKVLNELKTANAIPAACALRQSKSLDNLIEQDHRCIKRLGNPGLGFGSCETAWRTLQGYEVMSMMRKGQVQGVGKGEILAQVACSARLFRAAA
jgi:transposase, IS6 family